MDCQHENYSVYECPKCQEICCFGCAPNNRAESPSPERAFFNCPNCGWNIDSYDETEIAIIPIKEDSELYYKYNCQSERQDAELVLDLEARTLKADVDYNIGGSISGRSFNGLDISWGIPPLKVKSLHELMNEIKADCLTILDDSKVDHDGSNFRGYLGHDAEESRERIERIIEDFQGDEWQVWDAADWFGEDNNFIERIGLNRKTTDEEIRELAEKLEKETKEEDEIGLEDVENYLETLRANLIEEYEEEEKEKCAANCEVCGAPGYIADPNDSPSYLIGEDILYGDYGDSGDCGRLVCEDCDSSNE